MKAVKGKSEKQWMKEYPSSELAYPSLYVDQTEMPEIENWEVGKEYELKVRIKMTKKDEYANGADTNARLELVAYEDITPKVDNDPSTPKTQMTSDGFMPKL